MKGFKVNKKQVLINICAILLGSFMAIMALNISYTMGKEAGKKEIVSSVNSYFEPYNIYMVEKEPVDGRTYQLGSGRGFIKTATVYKNKYLQYDYEDGKLVFKYDNIKWQHRVLRADLKCSCFFRFYFVLYNDVLTFLKGE